MLTDRRSFFRLLAGATALLSGRVSAAKPAPGRFDIHEATRNTRLGALGARRPRLRGPPPSFKPYEGRRRVALPALADAPGRALAEIVRQWAPAAGFSGAAITLAQLGRLLHFTNGITSQGRQSRGGPALRAAPSAGALYSGEVYVAAARVDGLAPGLYYYAVAQHRLVEVAAGYEPARLADALEAPQSVEGAAAALLLTNVFGRYSWRYANRGYRYALIDSGHIGENLRLAAHSAGIAQRDFLAFRDDLLNEWLAIDGVREAVCSVHVIGLPGPAGVAKAATDARASSAASPHASAAPTASSEELPEALAGPGREWVEAQQTAGFSASGPIAERYHAATKLVARADSAAPFATPRDAAPRPLEPSVPLPAAAAGPAMKLEDAIEIRRSTRRFEPRSLALADLGHILEMACGHAALERSAGVDVHLVVHRVEGLERGLYRYDRERHRLVVGQARSLIGDFTRVCLGQEKAGSAAVGVLMVARLGEGRALATVRRYRDMLVESGAIGQRIYLAAESAGLSARNLAAFIDDDTNRLLGFDGERVAAVHLTMLGPGD